jgi:hypothetical protein
MEGNVTNPQRNELHIITQPSGHVLSTDCWCEVSKIYWSKNPNGEPILICEHGDDPNLPYHHKVVVSERNKEKDWITRLLNTIILLPPKKQWPPFGPEHE